MAERQELGGQLWISGAKQCTASDKLVYKVFC